MVWQLIFCFYFQITTVSYGNSAWQNIGVSAVLIAAVLAAVGITKKRKAIVDLCESGCHVRDQVKDELLEEGNAGGTTNNNNKRPKKQPRPGEAGFVGFMPPTPSVARTRHSQTSRTLLTPQMSRGV